MIPNRLCVHWLAWSAWLVWSALAMSGCLAPSAAAPSDAGALVGAADLGAADLGAADLGVADSEQSTARESIPSNATRPPPPFTPVRGMPTTRNSAVIDILDVSTGSAYVVRGRDNNNQPYIVVLDAGSNDATFGRIMSLFTAADGLALPADTVIDHFILSHAHRDHLSGTYSLSGGLFKLFSVRNIWDPGAPFDEKEGRHPETVESDSSSMYGCLLQRVVEQAKSATKTIYHPGRPCPTLKSMREYLDVLGKCNGATIPNFTRRQMIYEYTPPSPTNQNKWEIQDGPKGSEVSFGPGVKAYIMYSKAGIGEKDLNNSSIIVRFDFGGATKFHALFMGDEEKGVRNKPSNPPTGGAEKGLLDTWGMSNELQADLIVLGHHGSETSSSVALLEKVFGDKNAAAADKKKRYAVVSSGPKPYSGTVLPSNSVLVELRGTRPGNGWVRQDHLLRTDLNDKGRTAPYCPNNMNKVSPVDDTNAGCNNIELVITNGVLQSAGYWPMGPAVAL